MRRFESRFGEKLLRIPHHLQSAIEPAKSAYFYNASPPKNPLFHTGQVACKNKEKDSRI